MERGLPRMLYRVREAAEILGVSQTYIRERIRRGEIRAIRLDRRVGIPPEELAAIVERAEDYLGR